MASLLAERIMSGYWSHWLNSFKNFAGECFVVIACTGPQSREIAKIF